MRAYYGARAHRAAQRRARRRGWHDPRSMEPRSSQSACSPATGARWRARSRSSRTASRPARELVREVYPHTGRAAIVGFTGPPGAGKSTLIAALVTRRRAAGPPGRRALDRPDLAVHAAAPARRPHPPRRALPRRRRLHPLDGHARRARRPRRGGAAGGAADGRRRAATRSTSRRSASGRPRSTSSTTPTASCSCWCRARATRSRRSRPA